MRQFLLQMAGFTGSGKSTLAGAISGHTGAVVIDKDVIMAGALKAGVSDALAGPMAYDVSWELARFHLASGRSVILDNPASFMELRSPGQKIAKQAKVPYRIIECVVADRTEQERRVKARKRLHRLHPVSLNGVDLDYSRPGTAPIQEPRLVLDTTQSHFECLKQALTYLVADDAS